VTDPGRPDPGRPDPGRPDPGRTDLGFTDLGWARPDTAREARLGLPEVIYGPGKSAAQIAGVVTDLLAANTGPVLATRVTPETATQVLAAAPGGAHDPAARLLVWRPASPLGVALAVVSAGTADGPVAAEAAAVATAVGLTVTRITDVGVAGLHRLLAERSRLAAADLVICVAGMEGALASVLGGLVGCPVIAVPTSVGYGAALDGVTALLAMLSSCAPGVVVVNIDSGFGAAMAAYRMARRVAPR
jgi:pyridinium-3,5-biscarboxylic acid mononucleotide synthase